MPMLPIRHLLAFLLVSFSFTAGCGSDSDSAVPSRPARLRVLAGTVTVEGPNPVRQVRPGKEDAVVAGETLTVSAGGQAVLIDGAQLESLSGGAKLALEAAAPASGELERVRLLEGIVTFFFPKDVKKERRFEAITHTVVAAVRGTVFRVAVTADATVVTVLRGEVQVATPVAGAPSQPVRAAQNARATASGIDVGAASPEDVDRVRTDLLGAKAALGIDISNF